MFKDKNLYTIYFTLRAKTLLNTTIEQVFRIKREYLFWTRPGRLLLKGNVQLVQNAAFGLWEKTIAQLRKMFRTIPMNRYAIISVMLVCRFVYAKTLLDFEGWLEKTRHRKTIVMDILYACNFIKKWLQHRCFPVNFAKLSRATTL